MRKSNVVKKEISTQNGNGTTLKVYQNEHALCLTFLANATKNGFSECKYAMLPVSMLKVDHDYQRDLDESHVKEIAQNWNPNDCDDLIVNFRNNKEEFGFFIIDGQHRFEAARLSKVEMLPCKIYEGKSPIFESQVFERQGSNHKKLTSFERFKNLVFQGNMNALIVKKLCDKYHIKYDRYRQGNCLTLGGMTPVLEVAQRFGANGVEWIFSLIKQCGWHGDRNAYSSVMIRALGTLYGTYQNRDQIAEALINALTQKSYTPDMTITKAMAEHPGRNPARALFMLFQNISCNI